MPRRIIAQLFYDEPDPIKAILHCMEALEMSCKNLEPIIDSRKQS